MSASNQGTRPLAGLPVGTRFRIQNIELPDDILQRLLEMGLMTDTEAQVERYAPLGDPIEIKLRGYHLSLRATEAAGIQVTILA